MRSNLITILIICDPVEWRQWHSEILRRLMRAGYSIGVRYRRGTAHDRQLDRILRFEGTRAADSLARLDIPPVELQASVPDLVLDFTSKAEKQAAPVLSIDINGHSELSAGLAAWLANGSVQLVAHLDGAPVLLANPMLDDRVWLGRAATGLLAGAATLVEMCIQRFAADQLKPIAPPPLVPAVIGGIAGHYVRHLATALGQRVWHRLTRRRPFYWQTAYRFIDGPDVAEAGSISGAAFTELPDDGTRFYADPFAFEWEGKPFLFVEDFPYEQGRGVISVAELGPDGRFGKPRPAIVEAHHLSYPQVFARDGEIYMIPEGSGARELVLYRAVEFPLKWERAAVLVSGRRLNDMTLLERDGRFWLIGTEQVGRGSASDTLVAWSATNLTGPWTPHRQNPIRIDSRAARPGGRFIERDGKLLLPLQDGSSSYGGGLGLAELEALNEDEVRFGPVSSIGMGDAWADRSIHTLTRAGRLEAIDSADLPRARRDGPAPTLAEVRRRQAAAGRAVSRLGA
jgi:hypothetical protein